MNLPLLAVCLNLALAWYMTGVVLLVQRVQYPHLALLPKTIAPDCHRRHMRDITPVVAPAMLLELFTSILLLFSRPAWLTAPAAWSIFTLTAAAWLLTFALAVPQHNRLARQWDPVLARRLTACNWLRVLAWSSRAILLSAVLYAHLRSAS